MKNESVFDLVTSDVISAKLSDIHRLSWEYKAEFFLISNTNLNRKKCNNFCENIFIWAKASLYNTEIRIEKSLRIHFKIFQEPKSQFCEKVN